MQKMSGKDFIMELNSMQTLKVEDKRYRKRQRTAKTPRETRRKQARRQARWHQTTAS
jgi:hypothetical protein